MYVFLATAVVAGTLFYILSGQTAFLPTFYLILIQAGLGLLVYFQNRRSEINFSFAAFALLFALWSYCAYFVTQPLSPQLTSMDKFIFVPAALLLAFFLYFTYVFPQKKKTFEWTHKILIFLFPFWASALTPFNLIIRDISIKNGTVVPIFGAAYPLYMLFALIYIVLGLYNLVKSYYTVSGVEKLQIRYVFLGLTLSLVTLSISNLILPWLGEARLASVGSFFTLFFVGFTAYAILKHRLMSIEVVIQRSTVYGVATILIMAFYALAVMVSEKYLRNIIGYSSLVVTALAALVIAVVYQPLVKVFQNLTDRFFFRGRYDYQKTLRSVSSAIATKIRLEDLSRLIITTFVETMGVSEISFLIYDRDRKRFRSVYLELPQAGTSHEPERFMASRYKRIELDEESSIISWLKKTKDILILEELKEESEVKEEGERLGVAIWVPIVSKDELIGVISLGNKLTGDIYSYEDIGLLSTLANQTAVALENARLYEEVVNARNYIQEILESMVTGVLTVDARGSLVTFNPMAETISGLSSAEVLGRSYEEVFSKKSVLVQVIEGTLKDRCYTNFEAGLVSKKRGLVPVSVSSTVLFDSRNKKIGALVSLIDLTEVKELEGKVRQADKLGALGTMAAGMAHEIKNPLSSMKVLSQLLPLKYQDQEFREKLLEIMPREIDRIDRIVESLLSFARATAPQFKKLKIEEVIEENMKYFAEQAKSSGVKIVKAYGDLPEIEGDHDQLSQVFSNLILNALQAMPEGGELKIETRPGKQIENILQNVIIMVADTGHGIPPENLKRLFDPFFTTKYAGTGLGLSISHNIVDGHHGFIDVKSEVGRGTVFTVALPVSQELI